MLLLCLLVPYIITQLAHYKDIEREGRETLSGFFIAKFSISLPAVAACVCACVCALLLVCVCFNCFYLLLHLVVFTGAKVNGLWEKK